MVLMEQPMDKSVTIAILLLWACGSAKESSHDVIGDKGFENPGNGTAARHSEDLLHEAEAVDRIFLETPTDGAEIQDSDAPLPSDGICNSCSPYFPLYQINRGRPMQAIFLWWGRL
jgi:hypothetical protein